MSEPSGEPSAYTVLEPGARVFSSDGQDVGKVAHVLADFEKDIFDGLVIDASGRQGGHVFADASLIDEIRTGGVRLSLDRERCRALPEPSENPAALDAGAEETTPDDLDDKLRRAWDRISGRY